MGQSQPRYRLLMRIWVAVIVVILIFAAAGALSRSEWVRRSETRREDPNRNYDDNEL